MFPSHLFSITIPYVGIELLLDESKPDKLSALTFLVFRISDSKISCLDDLNSFFFKNWLSCLLLSSKSKDLKIWSCQEFLDFVKSQWFWKLEISVLSRLEKSWLNIERLFKSSFSRIESWDFRVLNVWVRFLVRV